VYEQSLDISEMHFLPLPVFELLTVQPAIGHFTNRNAYTLLNCTTQRGMARFTLRSL